jgi:hypothetical protein
MKKKMRHNKPNRFFPLTLIAAFAVSMGISYFYLKGTFEFDSSFIDELTARQTKTEPKEQKENVLRLYEPKDIISESSDDTNPQKDASLAAAEDIIRKYLKAFDTKLLDLYMDKENIVYVDLGNELKKNFRGGASEELNIIAGLYKGIEQAVPGFKALKILIEGHEAETLGGHIDISEPIGKEIAENI